jgi:hypothetical protein
MEDNDKPKPLFVAVNSSNIAAIAYFGGELLVRFKSGDVYAYESVSEDVYQAFLIAGSKGQYLWRVIRNSGADNLYPCRKIS